MASGSRVFKPRSHWYQGFPWFSAFSAINREKSDSQPPFSAQKALTRNHTIYAMGEKSLVVAAREGTGGSWRGAVDCLRGGFSPVYVWNGENADTAGNRALCALGAKPYSLEAGLSDQIPSCAQVSLF